MVRGRIRSVVGVGDSILLVAIRAGSPFVSRGLSKSWSPYIDRTCAGCEKIALRRKRNGRISTSFELKFLDFLSTLYAIIIAHSMFYSLVARFLLRILKGMVAPGFKLRSPNFAGLTLGSSSRSLILYRSAISAADKIIAFFARNRPGQIAWPPKCLVSFQALEMRLLILTTVRNPQSLKSIQIEGSFVIVPFQSSYSGLPGAWRAS